MIILALFSMVHGVCILCSTCQLEVCYACVKNAVLITGSRSDCQCLSGYYSSNNECLSCTLLCLSCAIPIECTTLACPENSSLISDVCVCLDGYVMDDIGNCVCANGYLTDPTGACYCPDYYIVDAKGQCVCVNGFTVDANGNCVCTNGFSIDNSGSCICPAYNIVDNYGYCVCTNGFIIDSSGSCTCPAYNIINDLGYCVCTNGFTIDSTGSCTCPAHNIINDLGYCVCTNGFTIDSSGSCTCPAHNIINDLGYCVCTNGFSIDNSGSCICPAYNIVDNYGYCVCTNGFTIDSSGSCTCPAHNIINDLGYCVCTNGFTIDSSGSCTCPTYNIINDLGYCVCTNGFIIDSSGSCTCPTYNIINDLGYCVCANGFIMDESGLCTCPAYYIIDKSGNCICTNGFVLDIFNSCICDQGYYITSDNYCLACDNTCQLCYSSSICEICKYSYSEPDLSSYLGRCKCIDGYYLSESQCTPCHITCSKCTSSICNVCKDSIALIDLIGTNGSCYCPSGYYIDQYGYCKPCDISCSTCTLETCTKCKSSNAYVIRNYCECNKGYYTLDGSNCLSCDISCANCSSLECYECKDSKAYISKKSCKCPDGTYSLNANVTCNNCPSDCELCTGPSSCYKCLDNNASPINGICLCKTSYVLLSSVCILCDSSCKTCSGDNICTSCVDENAEIVSDSSKCICKNSYYLDVNKGKCLACDETCLVCEENLCLECKDPNSKADGKTCLCQEREFFNGTLCEMCQDGCLSCDKSGCLLCVDHSVIDGSLCLCEENRVLVNNTCQCKDGYLDQEVCVKCYNYITQGNIVSGFFSEDYLSLYINFNSCMSITTSVLCENIFPYDSLEKLGSDPLCSLINCTFFQIILGTGAFVKAEHLNINPGVFLTPTNPCAITPENLYIDLIYKYPLVTPEIYILGPDKVSYHCTSQIIYTAVVYNTLKSTGNFSWDISSDLIVEKQGMSLIVNIDGYKGNDVEVVLTAENYLGGKSEKNLITQILSEKFISIEIVNGNYRKIKSSQGGDFTGQIANNCGIEGSDSWLWLYTGSNSDIEVDIKTLMLNNNTSTFIIDPYILSPGTTHYFTVSLTKDSYKSTADLIVEVEFSDLILLVSRTSGSISTYFNTNISAANSYDPDLSPLDFYWKITGYNEFSSSMGKFLILKPEYMDSNKDINIELTISTGQKQKKTNLILQTVSLNVEAQCEIFANRINLPDLKVVNVSGPAGMTFSWMNSNDKQVSLYPGKIIPFISKPTTYSLVISSNGENYYVNMTMTPNLPPECSSVMINSTTGKGFEDNFLIAANDCHDTDEMDYPLIYTYGASNDDFTLVIYGGLYTSQLTTVLFPGVYVVDILVCDSAFMCISISSSIVNIKENTNVDIENVYGSIGNKPAGVVLVGMSQAVTKNLQKTMIYDIGNCTFAGRLGFYKYISVSYVLLPYFLSDINEILIQATKIYKYYDDLALKLVTQFVEKALLYDLTLENLFLLDKFLQQAIKKTSFSKFPGETSEQTTKLMSIYQSRFLNSAIFPSFIYGNASFDQDHINNLHITIYSQPYQTISLSFTDSGSFISGNLIMQDDEYKKLDNLNLFIILDSKNYSKPVCAYVNESGTFPNDGCEIYSSDDENTVLKISHTSFFSVFDQDSNNNSDDLNKCKRSLLPSYLLGFLLVFLIILEIVTIKLDHKMLSFHEFEMQPVRQESEPDENHDDEEIKEEIVGKGKLEENSPEPLPSKTFSMPYTPQYNPNLLDFHLYLGIFHFNPVFLRPLKVFIIISNHVAEIFFIGLLLSKLENVREQDNNIGKLNFVIYSCYAVSMNVPFQVFLYAAFMAKRNKNGVFMAIGFGLGIIQLVTFTIFTFSFNYWMCSEWSGLWAYLFFFSIGAEVFFLQSCIMVVFYCCNRKNRQVISND
ncbi:hypothetical protein SteCoe_12677 [Stentor coeruleus]|uniref:EGF-like domain-containing protein n=1 Tax=Stentor coeruleus TaxID=5963 RepID=A0A1R2CA77_9CILI|nr:hypothetical protein SteCoe_12677 [Stentor coeruleus]